MHPASAVEVDQQMSVNDVVQWNYILDEIEAAQERARKRAKSSEGG